MKKALSFAYVFAVAAGILWMVFLVSRISSAQQGTPRSAPEQQPVRLVPSLEGADIFQAHCATCHGVDGQGGGPMAPALNTKMPDLTTLSRRNGGVFPGKRVRTVIAGDEEMASHGSRDMPVWGPIFHQIERDRDYGNVRLQNITKYLESIQRK